MQSKGTRLNKMAQHKKKHKSNKKLIKVILLVSAMILLLWIGERNLLDNEYQSENATEVQEISTATIGSMGDLLIHSPFLTHYEFGADNWNFDGIFTQLKPYINKLDYAVIDLEGTLSDGDYSGYPAFRAPEEVADSVKAAGFDMVLTANNHLGDGGESGFIYTLNKLKEKKIDFIGSRLANEDKKYIIKDINGIKIGMANWTYGQLYEDGMANINGIDLSAKQSKLMEIYDYDQLERFYQEQQYLIDKMKSEGAEAIIYYMHWGDEYKIAENELQSQIAQSLCNLGVDVIIGGHPHVIQPIEYLKADNKEHRTICIYSLGNALSNQRTHLMDLKTGHTEDGVLYMLTFSKFSNGTVKLSKVEFIPTWVELYTVDDRRNYVIIPLDQNGEWKNHLSGSDSVDAALASYNRTMEILQPGLDSYKVEAQTVNDQ